VGYGENLLDNSNAYLLRYSRKAASRMADMAVRFSGEHGIRSRMLNLGAKQALLAQSSDWPRMIQRGHFQNYAAQCFRENIAAFTTVFDSLASNTLSTEWLTEMEKRFPLFPWMNYRAFIQKENP
jgi:1,4-alpha-glucan branching enzyme